MLLFMTRRHPSLYRRTAAALAVPVMLFALTAAIPPAAFAHLDENLRGVPPSDRAEWNYHGISAEESRQWIEEGIIFAAWAAQWKGEGFNARSAGQWHGIANVYTAGKFLRNGFSPDEAREWMDSGIRSGERAAEYLAAGFTAKEAGTFWSRSLYPEEAKEWKNAGFDAQSTLEWRYGPRVSEFYFTKDARYSQEVHDVNFAKTWRSAGFGPEEAHRARTYQIKLDEALEWKQAGFPFREMVLWKDSGFSLEDAAARRNAGLSAQEAELRQHDSSVREDEVTEFFADMTVRSDGTLEIIEMITVIDRPGGFFRNGFHKLAPAQECGLWNSRSTYAAAGMKVRSVEVDGRPAAYVPADQGIQVMQNGAPLPEGEHRITLAYTTGRMVRDEPHHDELCFVLVGDLPPGNYLRSAAATVRLPKGGHVIFSRGTAGLRERTDFLTETEETEAGDIVRYTVTRPLRQDMSFSIDLGFVKGYARPSWLQRLDQVDRKTRRFLSSLFLFLSGLVVCTVYYVIVWHRVGRDPKPRGSATTEFSPPKEVDPPRMRALMARGTTDHLSAAAALLALANRGFIRVLESGGAYRIERTEPEQAPLPESDKEFLSALFQERSTVILAGRSKNRQLAHAGRLLKRSMQREYRRRTEKNTRYLWPGVGLSLLFLGASLAVIDTSRLSFHGKAAASLVAYGAVVAAGFSLLSLLFSRLLRRPTREHVDLQEKLRAYAAFLKQSFADLPGRTYLPPFLQKHLPYAIAAGIAVDGLQVRSGEVSWYQGDSGGFACGDFITTIKRSL
ncbi:MAG: DUF2207 domain-containing protein [Nitrospirota bacterium]|nr:DUF2207 domain-containing protein [Nitrospirota bacterium]